MKNKITFIAISIILTILLLSIVSFTAYYNDKDGGSIVASSWTYWDPEGQIYSYPVIESWCGSYSVTSQYPFSIQLNLTRNAALVAYWPGLAGEQTHCKTYGPVMQEDASLYSTDISVTFNYS